MRFRLAEAAENLPGLSGPAADPCSSGFVLTAPSLHAGTGKVASRLFAPGAAFSPKAPGLLVSTARTDRASLASRPEEITRTCSPGWTGSSTRGIWLAVFRQL